MVDTSLHGGAWGGIKCVHSPAMKGGSQCDIVEKVAHNPICCMVDTSLHGGAWGGTKCVHGAATKEGS